MKFFVIAALIAVVAADSYSTNSYQQAKPAAYSAPAYSSPSYSKNDYAATPYEFEWAVNDEYYNDFSHKESGDGNGKASGSYRVVLPDGRTQIVTYTADSYGYVADVKYEGEAKYPEYKQSSYSAPAYSAPAYKPAAAYKPAPAYRPSTPAPYSAPAEY